MSAQVLLARLEGVKGRDGHWRARCPVHGSRSGTLAIRELPTGQVLLKCHAQCDTQDILQKVGLNWEDLFPDRLTDECLAPIKKPWHRSDVLKAFDFELLIAWIILGDLAAGKEASPTTRERAGIAKQRIERFRQELDNAG
jgi:hypothetical protein